MPDRLAGEHQMPGPCLHSMMVNDCVSCWAGAYQRAAHEIKRLTTVVRYVSRPTMTLPGGWDAEKFAVEAADERDVRGALATCIRMCRVALEDGEGVSW